MERITRRANLISHAPRAESVKLTKFLESSVLKRHCSQATAASARSSSLLLVAAYHIARFMLAGERL